MEIIFLKFIILAFMKSSAALSSQFYVPGLTDPIFRLERCAFPGASPLRSGVGAARHNASVFILMDVTCNKKLNACMYNKYLQYKPWNTGIYSAKPHFISISSIFTKQTKPPTKHKGRHMNMNATKMTDLSPYMGAGINATH